MTGNVRNVSAACELLRHLLTHDPDYRQRWRPRTNRKRSDLSQSAVAKVIESHLIESGERSETQTTLSRQLKDRVSRALNGSTLSTETLHWFIEAFDMTQADRTRLWETLYSRTVATNGISHTLRRRREMIKRQRHRTIALFERYTIDASGSLTARHTLHRIRAIEDGVDMYIFNHEPQATHVTVIHGGALGKGYEYGGGLTSVEIILDRPLLKNETVGLEYWTNFNPGATRLTEVRRAAFARSEGFDLAVTFQDTIPRVAWRCIWDDQIDGSPIEEEHVHFQGNTIQMDIPFIEETVVGFRWEW